MLKIHKNILNEKADGESVKQWRIQRFSLGAAWRARGSMLT